MKEYRRRRGADTWHFNGRCQHWPREDEEFTSLHLEEGQRPRSGELCNECLGKERAET
jgi:hypothetical protein